MEIIITHEMLNADGHPKYCMSCGRKFKYINKFNLNGFALILCEECALDLRECILQNLRTTEEV